jgi:hypothetical protein
MKKPRFAYMYINKDIWNDLHKLVTNSSKYGKCADSRYELLLTVVLCMLIIDALNHTWLTLVVVHNLIANQRVDDLMRDGYELGDLWEVIDY